MSLRRLWKWMGRREPEPRQKVCCVEDDPMYQEVLMRAYRSGKVVVGNRDERGVTITEHEIK